MEHLVVEASNPMENELILDTFFNVCSVETLKTCRLVCKQWRNESMKVWRKKAMICLSTEDRSEQHQLTNLQSPSVVDYLRRYQDVTNRNRKNISRKQYVDEPRQLHQYPFKNFRIDGNLRNFLKMDTGSISDVASHVKLQNIYEDVENLTDFFKRFHSLESLELKKCRWWGLETELKYLELPVLPNLKRLKMDLHGVLPGYGGRGLFQYFPNLQVLRVEHCDTMSYISSAKDILKMVNAAKSNKKNRRGKTVDTKPMTLKELEIINVPDTDESKSWTQRFDSSFIEEITTMEFPLEKLALDLTFSGEMKMYKVFGSIHSLLCSMRESVQCIRLRFFFDIDNFIERIIRGFRVEKDRKLKICRELRPVASLDIISMDSLKEMTLANGVWGLYLLAHLELPNLETLVVEYGKFTKKVNILEYQVLLFKTRVFPKLETFELRNYHAILEPKEINMLANMMPNLCILSAPLDEHAFRTVCKIFTGLKTLNILAAPCRYSGVDDEVLTGISKQDESRELRRPNITDLRLLTDLFISSDVAFTDHAVIYGFLQLPRLYFLSVTFKKVSNENKSKLLNHVKGSVLLEQEERERIELIDSDEDISNEEGSNLESSEESDSYSSESATDSEDSDG